MTDSSISLTEWELKFEAFILSQPADSAHNIDHVKRVCRQARRLTVLEKARLEVVVPAAWLHDCIAVPKDSHLRSQASRLAAEAALEFLKQAGYPEEYHSAISHAIEAHSFSAAIKPESTEARIVQDADRLEALGAIGIYRCLVTGQSMGRPFYDSGDPFCDNREADDTVASLDHFYTKLLKLAGTMQTAAGRHEAEKRTAFMHAFLEQLRSEIS